MPIVFTGLLEYLVSIGWVSQGIGISSTSSQEGVTSSFDFKNVVTPEPDPSPVLCKEVATAVSMYHQLAQSAVATPADWIALCHRGRSLDSVFLGSPAPCLFRTLWQQAQDCSTCSAAQVNWLADLSGTIQRRVCAFVPLTHGLRCASQVEANIIHCGPSPTPSTRAILEELCSGDAFHSDHRNALFAIGRRFPNRVRFRWIFSPFFSPTV